MECPRCGHGTFVSADRSRRCRGCHLVAPDCNCDGETRLRLMRMLGLIQTDED